MNAESWGLFFVYLLVRAVLNRVDHAYGPRGSCMSPCPHLAFPVPIHPLEIEHSIIPGHV